MDFVPFRTSSVRLLASAFVLVAAGCSSSRVATDETSVANRASDPEPAGQTTESGPSVESLTSGQESPNVWFQDETTDSRVGAEVVPAYAILEGRSPQKQVIVAVIDSGVDINHEDLKDNIWTNEDEVPSNGIDDDNNGYVDDVHGWNFIGGRDGRNVEFDTYEMTRELVRLQDKYGQLADAEANLPGDSSELAYYRRVKEAFEDEKARMTEIGNSIDQAIQAATYANNIIATELGTARFSIEDVTSIVSDKPEVKQAQGILVYLNDLGISDEELHRESKEVHNRLTYGLDPGFDPREIVGDDYKDVSESHYGNSDVVGPDPLHGTHVAGIIAASRSNGKGIDGIAPNARIMVVRAVPNGDERDKDVANAIRYAVDNGADVINMSFGKSFSPNAEVVAEAISYADSKGVLMIHAAGNDAADNDGEAHFPSRQNTASASPARHWVEVGASTDDPSVLVAPFSNYGSTDVDVFAPGTSILSTVPNNHYNEQDGTSMAAPVVSGVAALLMSYFPALSPAEVRNLILSSAQPYGGHMVLRPGSDDRVEFGSLSVTGGVVSARRAVAAAESL